MKEILITLSILLLVLILVIGILYVLVGLKMKHMNTKIFRYKEQKDLKDKNILIVYQPSSHGSVNLAVETIKEEVINKGYGYCIHTLTKLEEDYSLYKDVILVSPVYFQEINVNYLKKLPKGDFIMVYLGMKKEENPENDLVKKIHKGTYRSIKVDANSIDELKSFIKGAIR